jgi:GT2 family glycosyltransferase
MEDAEYSWRVQRAGLELIYAPRAIVYHKVGTTFGARDASTLTAYHQSRHRMYFARRNLRGTIRAAALAYMLITKPGRALIDLCQGRRAIGGATVRGMWAGLTTRAVDRADSASR